MKHREQESPLYWLDPWGELRVVRETDRETLLDLDRARAQAERLKRVWERKADANENRLEELKTAVKPILSAYCGEPARITEEQITRAWAVFDG